MTNDLREQDENEDGGGRATIRGIEDIGDFQDSVDIEIESGTEMDIFNFELPLETRVAVFKRVGSFSTVCRLISVLNISNSSLVRKMLIYLCRFEPSVSEVWRLEIAYALIESDRTEGYRALDIALFNDRNSHKISIGCKIQACICLNNGVPSLRRPYLYLFDIITNEQLSCEYRYRLIKGLLGDSEISESLLEYCLATFITSLSGKDSERFRVFACQLCLVGLNERLRALADDELAKTILGPGDRALKADVADMILQFSGRSSSRSLARKTLTSLSFDSTIKTIYNNKENIHALSISQSALNTISALSHKVNTFQLKTFSAKTLTDLLAKYPTDNSETVYLNVYDRIRYFDNAVYSNNLSLRETLDLVWSFIQTLEEKLRCELERRLLEELFEMADTCSSGYFTRLANVFSGYSEEVQIEGLGVRVDWDEQIKAVFFAKINKAIKKEQDYILEDLLSSEKIEDKRLYQTFIRTQLPSIIDHIRREFTPHLPECDIDIYLRRSLSLFEGCGF